MSRVKPVAHGRKKRSRQQEAPRGKVSGPAEKPQRPTLLPVIRQFIPLLLTITALPIALCSKLWLAIWRGNLSRAWDGTGHSAIAHIYTQSIFPDTFGWTNAYFAGMPFPNFYPPVFYWCVGIIQLTHLVPFTTAFKIMIAVPVLLMPAALWLLGWFLSNRNKLVSTAAALAGVLLFVDVRFMGALLAGLDYFSTFQIGLYTQPLGFILLIAWFIVYSKLGRRNSADGKHSFFSRPRWKFALSSLLLALTVLANFFNATTAVVLIVATVICDAVYYRRALEEEGKRELRNILLQHLASPVVAMFLTLFWVVPLLNEYQYFVTRPYLADTRALFTPALAVWYAIAVTGVFLWLRNSIGTKDDNDGDSSVSRQAMWSYLGACTILGLAVIFASIAAPGWFPLQTPRFLATLTFMLSVPVGYAFAVGFQIVASLVDRTSSTAEIGFREARYATGLAVIAFLIITLTAPGLGWAYTFYPDGKRNEIDAILDFAGQHRDGRYLVEVINPKGGPAWTEASFDARAINSYLGAQGNETISGVFHEASPNVLFTLPTVNAFSNYPDSFGISSALSDDLDFMAQPLDVHIARSRYLGVKYLVIRTPAMKERISKERGIAARHDFGWWSLYELREQPRPFLEALLYKPALVVSSFTVKSRRRNEMSFVRLAEEQFADNWFDVLLARSPEMKLDLLANLHDFGALIVDTYEYEDETTAFNLLRDYSQKHLLILLASDAKLFQRIKSAQPEFPRLQIVDRSAEGQGEIIEAVAPVYHYNSSSIRRHWLAVRRILESNKEAVEATSAPIKARLQHDRIAIDYSSGLPARKIPVLIAATFHPNWRRDDEEGIFAATPFYMLTFVDHSTHLEFSREKLDRVAVWISATAVALLCLFAGMAQRKDI